MNSKPLTEERFLPASRPATVLAFSLPFLLLACASNTPAPVVNRAPATIPGTNLPRPAPGTRENGYYTVKRGDTLYSIALDNGQDYRDIAAWNNLENPNLIKVDQLLRVERPQGQAGASAYGGGAMAQSRPVPLSNGIEARPLDAGGGNTGSYKRDPKAGKEPYSDDAYARMQRGTYTPSLGGAAIASRPPVVVATSPQAASDAGGGSGEVSWGWPAKGKVVSTFSEGSNKGVDIAGHPGDPVLAAADGKVVYVGSSLPAYGQLVIIKHNNSNYLSAYAYNQRILVKEGQVVTRGTRIADMGSNDAGPRLHFEIRRQGKPVDPLPFLSAAR